MFVIGKMTYQLSALLQPFDGIAGLHLSPQSRPDVGLPKEYSSTSLSGRLTSSVEKSLPFLVELYQFLQFCNDLVVVINRGKLDL